ncbi:MAG: AMP-binding protein, partial [Ramlibacter sp.]|nr:AMP-binding protein [Ramlibacter sp.]
MDFDAVLLPARREESIAQGLWQDRTINDYLDACVAQHPDKLALTSISLDRNSTRRFTYREMGQMADRIAVGLTRLGIGRNDVVAMQLPNCWQFTLLYLACSRIGAVLNPMMHIFRERELKFMIGHAEAKLLVVPKVFRGFDYEGMAMALKPELPTLQQVVVVGSDAAHGFEALLSGPE